MSHELVAALQKTVDVKLIALRRPQYNLFWFVPFALFRGMMERRCDAIHVADGLLAPLGRALARITNRPYTVTVHGLDVAYSNKLYRSMVIPSIKAADRIVCVSENTRNLCLQNDCEAGRTVVIPNGISVGNTQGPAREVAREQIIQRYKINADDLILLSVGRLVKRKGVAWFLRQVHPSLKKTTLIVAGDGPARDEVNKVAREMEKTRILGRVDSELLRLLYRGSDAFIMPNIRVEGDVEGFGIVLLEAGCHGLYSFASNIDGIPEAVKDGVNGRLLESGNAEVWIRELSRFEGNRDDLTKMGEKARAHVTDNNSWERIAERYKSTWKEISRTR